MVPKVFETPHKIPHSVASILTGRYAKAPSLSSLMNRSCLSKNGQVKATLPDHPDPRLCRVLNISISRARLRGCAVVLAWAPRLLAMLAERLRRFFELHPTFGYRRRSELRFGTGVRINRKAVFPIRL
jgi:hypothetical protein